MRSSRLVQIGCVIAIGSIAGLLCHRLLPSEMQSAWRDGLSIAVAWLVVLVLAWPFRLGHEDVWWWPFAPPGSKDRGEA